MGLADRVSAWNRRRKWRLFLSVMAPGPATRVLDVGFAGREHGPSDNFLERHYPWPDRVTALGLERGDAFARRYPGVSVVRYGGGSFPFADAAFDLCWANAVLEHVGGPDAQVAFLREARRVARRGFVTTPNRWFPVEVHTRLPLLHWLPRPAFDRAARALGKGWAAGDYMHLLGRRALRRRLAAAGLPGATIRANRLGPWALDFVAIW